MTDGSITKLLCARNGSMSFDDLRSCGVRVEGLIDGCESCAVTVRDGRQTLIARTEVRLCRSTNCPGSPTCKKLHLCKHYLLGSCRFSRGRRVCRFSHDLFSDQNSQVLSAHGLQALDQRELCILLLQNDNSLLPAVCYSYNNGSGEYGRCQDGENCKRLHICEKYLRGPCNCTRSHDFYEPHPFKTLQARDVPSEFMAIMKDLYTNIEALRDLSRNKPHSAHAVRTDRQTRGPNTNIWRPSSTANLGQGQDAQRPFHSPVGKTEICMYFIKGHCKHGDSCRREHSSLPYKWEVKEGSEWKALPDSEAVEKDYCDPAKTYSSGIEPVCFDTMTRDLRCARRLSTVSSVIQPTFILTTEWLWYWEDEYGNWIQYATANGGHHMSSITCVALEQKYQEDSSAVVEFTAGSQTYELSFKDMIQSNKRYGTKKLVRRRPKYLSAADVQTIRTTKRAPNNFKALPTHWDKNQTPETGYKKVPLQSSAAEYREIERLFTNTMRGFNIHKIERIQNKALWEVFQWQKDRMKKNNRGGDVAEKQLFHGTDPKHIDAICRDNFDWRICGTHGTAFGKGSYFARDADYSHNYTKNAASRSMFVCRVLVGDSTKGDSSFLRPPSKDGGDTIFYDSCVNDVYNPSIYVVFEKHQIYPEYLIEYKDPGYYPQTPAAVTRPATVRVVPASNPAPRVTQSHTFSVHAPPSYSPFASSSSGSSSYTPSSRSYVPPPQKPTKSECIIS